MEKFLKVALMLVSMLFMYHSVYCEFVLENLDMATNSAVWAVFGAVAANTGVRGESK